MADAPRPDSGPLLPPEVSLDCAKHPRLLHAIFTDHVVLQRNTAVPIWGCSSANSTVSVQIAGQTVQTIADSTGLWRARLSPMPAGGPYDLEVKSSTSLTLRDVLIGDVWLCSGQSNMGLTVAHALDAAKEIDDALNYPAIRLFKAPGPTGSPTRQQVFAQASVWARAAPGTVGDFSAVCYFFARELYKSLGVPFGLINASVGGTGIEFWMSADALREDPDFAAELAQVEAGHYPKNKAFVTSLFNGKIAPIAPFALRAALWYQGEHNASRAAQYRRLLPALIRDWRSQLSAAELPFLIVQLPRYLQPQTQPSQDQGWPLLREAQLQTVQGVSATGLAVTIDTGTEDVHPQDKQDVGARLAALARGTVFGEDVAFTGPLFRGHAVEGNAIRIAFDGVVSGLMVGRKEPLQPVQEVAGGELTGFAIAGADKRFVWANASISGKTVVVSAPSVAAPVAVRYGWASNPPCNLYGKEGLPASPFRTDSW